MRDVLRRVDRDGRDGETREEKIKGCKGRSRNIWMGKKEEEEEEERKEMRRGLGTFRRDYPPAPYHVFGYGAWTHRQMNNPTSTFLVCRNQSRKKRNKKRKRNRNVRVQYVNVVQKKRKEINLLDVLVKMDRRTIEMHLF